LEDGDWISAAALKTLTALVSYLTKAGHAWDSSRSIFQNEGQGETPRKGCIVRHLLRQPGRTFPVKAAVWKTMRLNNGGVDFFIMNGIHRRTYPQIRTAG